MKKFMKRSAALLMALMVFVGTAMTVMAAGWQQNSTGWWYDNGNGTWPANSWQWIDGNGDGVAECYYFDGNGYMLSNTTTPDGFQVDASGAWTVNGVVQTQGTAQNTNTNNGSIPSGYNENGLSNVAIDILEHTRAENAAKYGETKVDEIAGEYYVYYEKTNIFAVYYETDEKPSQVSAKATDIFRYAPMTGNAYEDKEILKADGYSVTTNGGYVAVDCGKYTVDIRSDQKRADAYIKFDHK